MSGLLVAMLLFEDWSLLVDFAFDVVRFDLRDEVETAYSDSRVSAIELMQYRRPVGGGPSWNT